MRVLEIVAANSGRRVHNTVEVFAAANDATVVPHEPAPTTATLIDFDAATVGSVYGWPTGLLEPGAPNTGGPRAPHRLTIVMPPVSLVIPVRAFDDAKSRLSGVLSPRERRELAMTCARRVIGSIPHAEVFVVCDDDEVAEFARASGATAIRVGVEGLNPALTAGLPSILSLHPDHPVVIAHADLPFGDRLREFWAEISDKIEPSSFAIIPDARHDGSNVVVIGHELATRWRFAYGRGSFTAHVALARDMGVEPIVVDHDLLSLDLDTPDDLANPTIIGQLDRLVPNRSPK